MPRLVPQKSRELIIKQNYLAQVLSLIMRKKSLFDYIKIKTFAQQKASVVK